MTWVSLNKVKEEVRVIVMTPSGSSNHLKDLFRSRSYFYFKTIEFIGNGNLTA